MELTRRCATVKKGIRKHKKGRMNPIYPDKYAWIYVMPAVTLMVLMCLFPVFVLIWNSMTDFSLIKPDTHFARRSESFWKARWRSIWMERFIS